MTSYSNPFYEYMKQQKFKNGIKCIRSVDKDVKKAHHQQYLSYKHMVKKWRYNIKHVQLLKNRFIIDMERKKL